MYKLIFISVILLNYGRVYCQVSDSLIVVNSKTVLENVILNNIANHDDSLSTTIYTSGVLFFRFRTADGKVVDIKCARKQPAQLVNIITSALQKMKFADSGDSNIYVLPVLFDYSKGPQWEIENPQVRYKATYDVNDLSSYININNNGFFDVPSGNKTQFGIKSIFLPWILISRPVIYNYKDSIKMKPLKSKERDTAILNVVKDIKEFENIIRWSVYQHNDTLSKVIYQKEVLFFKFNVNKNARIENIKCSEKQPKLLIDIITTSLRNMKIGTSQFNKTDSGLFVLPVCYNYLGETYSPEKQFNTNTNIDYNDLDSYINLNKNGFFDNAKTDGILKGLKCTFLPWIKVSPPESFR